MDKKKKYIEAAKVPFAWGLDLQDIEVACVALTSLIDALKKDDLEGDDAASMKTMEDALKRLLISQNSCVKSYAENMGLGGVSGIEKINKHDLQQLQIKPY